MTMLQPLQDPSKRFFDQAVAEPSYIIFKVGDTILAKNGLTGQVEFSGTDASKVIQQAVDAVSNAGGGRIFIKRGTYNIETSIKPKSNVVIEAEGSTGTVFNLSQPYIFQGLGEPPVENFAVINGRFVIKANVRVMWFRETARNVVIKGSRLEIDPSIGTYASNFGIRFEKANYVVIDSITVEGAGTDTLQLDGSKVMVKNSYMDGKGQFSNAILLGAVETFILNNVFIGYRHNAVLSGTNRVVVANNYFYKCMDGIDIGAGASDWVIVGNQFVGGDTLIAISPGEARARNIVIAGNLFRQAGGVLRPVWAQYVDHLVVEANTVQNDSPYDTRVFICEKCNHIHIKNNAVYTPSYGGITHIVMIADSKYVFVEGNTFYGGPDGRGPIIQIVSTNPGDTSFVYIRRNYLRPNLYGNPDRESSGIVFNDQNATNVFIEDNVFDFGLKDRLIVNPPPGTVIRRNAGYPTEASGVATIAAGSTRVTVPHGLVSAPAKVVITPYANIRVWVENIGSTSFDIVADTAPATDVNVAWYAEV